MALRAVSMGGKRGRVLLALGGSLSLAALYVAYTRLQRKSTRRTKGAENGPAGLEVEPLEREEVGRKAFVHGSPESASPENARSRHHRVLSKWSEEQAREDIGKAIGEVLSYLESENLTEHALEGIRERLADLEDKMAAQTEVIKSLESSFQEALHDHKRELYHSLQMLKKELKGDVQGVRRDLKKLSELGEELAEKENMLEERINIGNSNKANHQVPLAMVRSPPRTPPRTPPLSPRRVYVSDWADF